MKYFPARSPYRRWQWHPTPVLLPGKSHGGRSLVGCSPWGRWGSETTEWLHFHFSLSCTGEGNGNPLQCSCLENPRDGGAWWPAIYGVAQSQTWLKWLSSSRSPYLDTLFFLIHYSLCRQNHLLKKCILWYLLLLKIFNSLTVKIKILTIDHKIYIIQPLITFPEFFSIPPSLLLSYHTGFTSVLQHSLYFLFFPKRFYSLFFW